MRETKHRRVKQLVVVLLAVFLIAIALLLLNIWDSSQDIYQSQSDNQTVVYQNTEYVLRPNVESFLFMMIKLASVWVFSFIHCRHMRDPFNLFGNSWAHSHKIFLNSFSWIFSSPFSVSFYIFPGMSMIKTLYVLYFILPLTHFSIFCFYFWKISSVLSSSTSLVEF